MQLGEPTALWWLLVVALTLAIMGWSQRARRRDLARLGDLPLLREMMDELSPRRRRLRQTLRVIALLALTLAVLRPQWGDHTELARHRGLDVVFALDVSRSMLARDVKPDRLDRAKAEISTLVGQLEGNRLGLVAFAGTAFVQCPLTTDAAALRMFLSALDPEVVPQGGTALAKALRVAERLFQSSAAQAEHSGRHQGQVLVLITDGEDHEGEVVEAAKALKDQGVTVFAVGIGSEEGEPIPTFGENAVVTGYLKDKQGKPVLSRLELGTLRSLSDAAGGQLLSGPGIDRNLMQVARDIDKLQKAEFESRLVVQHQERFQWPLALGMLALGVRALVGERKKKVAGPDRAKELTTRQLTRNRSAGKPSTTPGEAVLP
ncbi:MAG: VWA domain-containing protein [Pseudomonadota bacterium]